MFTSQFIYANRGNCHICSQALADYLSERDTKMSNYQVQMASIIISSLKGVTSHRHDDKPRRQRERHQTKGLMSRTMAMHVRYKSLYISLPSSAKQQREMTKFCVLYGTWTTTANISYFHLELHATITHLARARF